jgi:CDP-paratose 2-epimerase
VLAVEDLMRAFEAVRSRIDRTAGQVYNLGGGLKNATSLLELIDAIRVLTGYSLDYDIHPVRPGDQPVYLTDSGKLRRDVGWEPQMTLEQILENMHEWWKEHRELFRPTETVSRFSVSELQPASGIAS